MSFRAIALTATLVASGLVPLLQVQAAVAASGHRSLCDPPADTVGPVATSVTFGRASIDLDSGSRKQTVTVQASDTSGTGAASGVAAVQIYITGDRTFSAPKLTLVSGTPTSGAWSGSFVVSKYAHPGTYSINDLSVTDAARNEQDYPGYSKVPDGPDALSLHPADNPTFAVTGTPATRPPGKPAGKLRTFSISPTHVNTTASGRLVHFAARFAGREPQRISVETNSAKKSSHSPFVFLHAELHKHGNRWRGELRVPRWLGRQKLATDLFASFAPDSRPRNRSYDSEQLQHRHLASTIAVVSGVDHSRPKLTSLSLSPDPIDSTTGPESVTVTADVSDTGSGVHFVEIDGGIRHGVNGVATGSYPYAAAGVGFLSSQDFHVRLRKTANGSWVGTTTVRRCVPSGTYKLSADLRDAAGNYRYYSTKKLANAHLTSTVDVTSKHGDVTAPYVYSAATYGADHELFLNFSEGVKNVSTNTLTVFSLSPRTSRYDSTSTIAALVCSNGTVTVDCSGSAGLVTSAVLTVPGMVAGQKYQVFGNLDQVVPQLTDGNGNPLDWNEQATEVLDA